MPSPASSVGSQSSVGSMGSSGVTATISTPVTIQNMTSAYVNFTSHVLKAFDLWDQAEALTKKNKGEGLCGSSQCGMEVGGVSAQVSRRKRWAVSLPSPSALLHNPSSRSSLRSVVWARFLRLDLCQAELELALALCLLTCWHHCFSLN